MKSKRKQKPERPVDKAHRDLAVLIALSISVKILVVFVTTSVFGSFVDRYDLLIYLQYAQKISNGQIPYLNFPVEYPQGFFIPMIISIVSAPITVMDGSNIFPRGGYAFMFNFTILMVMCDTLTLMFVYLTAKKLFGRDKAFLSGILYATAFSSAYFVITKYDAFPAFLLMGAIAMYVYGKKEHGVIGSALGFMTKWFPGFAAEFFILRDLKSGEGTRDVTKSIALFAGIVSAIIFPFVALNVDEFMKTYTLHIGRTPLSSSFVYYLDYITHSGFFSFIAVYLIGSAVLAIALHYYKFADTGIDTMVGYIFMTVFAFVFLNKVLSPQYIVWIAPFIAIFLTGTYREMLLAYASQLIFYIEFPILYNKIYINNYYFEPAGTAFVFFTVKFAIMFYIAYAVFKKIDKREHS